MVKSTSRVICQLVLTVLLIGAGGSSVDGGTPITVKFSGTDTATNTVPFSGSFIYDSAVTGTGGVFTFTGAPVHVISFNLPGCAETGSQKTSEPFTITTVTPNNKTFGLQATDPQPPWATTVKIVLPTNTVLNQTSLPNCSVFPNPPNPNSTFTLSGGINFAGTIQTISCSPPAPAPPEKPNPVGGCDGWPQAIFDSSNWYPAPVKASEVHSRSLHAACYLGESAAVYPVYERQPQAAFISKQLFHRRKLHVVCP